MAASTQDPRLGNPPATGQLAHQAIASRAPFKRYLRAVEELVEADVDDLPCRIAAEISKLVAQPDWLPEECCEPGEDCYRRHLLYADPAGRFTILALVWQPGQTTPVHGHTAWGAVGVYRGHPSVAVYRCCEHSAPAVKAEYHCCPGQVSHVLEGVQEPHRIFNDSDRTAITIHTYGRDLTKDPACINILV